MVLRIGHAKEYFATLGVLSSDGSGKPSHLGGARNRMIFREFSVYSLQRGAACQFAANLWRCRQWLSAAAVRRTERGIRYITRTLGRSEP
jgi:hypothetical protein